MSEEENILYNKTQEFGRTQFVRELLRLQQENEQLKEELKDWDRIFDTFSKRKYAHRYLEERRKEIPTLLCPDSDEIYQKYYELKDNWNKLKEFAQELYCEPISWASCGARYILEKMQELEKGEENAN